MMIPTKRIEEWIDPAVERELFQIKTVEYDEEINTITVEFLHEDGNEMVHVYDLRDTDGEFIWNKLVAAALKTPVDYGISAEALIGKYVLVAPISRGVETGMSVMSVLRGASPDPDPTIYMALSTHETFASDVEPEPFLEGVDVPITHVAESTVFGLFRIVEARYQEAAKLVEVMIEDEFSSVYVTTYNLLDDNEEFAWANLVRDTQIPLDGLSINLDDIVGKTILLAYLDDMETMVNKYITAATNIIYGDDENV